MPTMKRLNDSKQYRDNKIDVLRPPLKCLSIFLPVMRLSPFAVLMARVVKSFKFYAHAFIILFSIFVVLPLINRSSEVVVYERFLSDMKHILIWTPIHGLASSGQNLFIDGKCQNINCYLTSNRTLFGDPGVFDAILFNLQDVAKGVELPDSRSFNQKYVFAANDTPENYPVCDKKFDEAFNWTWTYRSDSTLHYHFITNYNSLQQELGVNVVFSKNVTNMEPIGRDMQRQLRSKHKAVAWFHDDCDESSFRETFVRNLNKYLGEYNLSVDVYGKCGPQTCRRRTMKPCYWRLQKEYYFYLVVEPSFSDEFVSREVLIAYDNNAVPIVFGGASYDKFLPPNSFIEAYKFGEEDVAEKIYQAMNDRAVYSDYFRWKKYYSVKPSPVFDVCLLCEKLNDPLYLTYRLINKSFRSWWHHGRDDVCPGFLERLGF